MFGAEYVKVKKIGEGSFGSAWLVKHNKNHMQYVIKQINVSKVNRNLFIFKPKIDNNK